MLISQNGLSFSGRLRVGNACSPCSFLCYSPHTALKSILLDEISDILLIELSVVSRKQECNMTDVTKTNKSPPAVSFIINSMNSLHSASSELDNVHAVTPSKMRH